MLVISLYLPNLFKHIVCYYLYYHSKVNGLLSLPWSVHGKYMAISQLVPALGTSTLLSVSIRNHTDRRTNCTTRMQIGALYYERISRVSHDSKVTWMRVKKSRGMVNNTQHTSNNTFFRYNRTFQLHCFV